MGNGEDKTERMREEDRKEIADGKKGDGRGK